MHLIRTGAALLGAAALSFVLQGQDHATGAAACTTTFTSSSGSWSVASNWSAGVPVATSYACIPVGRTATLGVTTTVDGVRIQGTLNGAGTLRISDQGPVSESELDGDVMNASLNLLAGGLVVETASMGGSGTTTVGSGAVMRVTNPDSNGLLVNDSRQLVINGALLVEHTAGSPESIYLNLVGTGVTINGTLDLRNGADVVGPGTLVLSQGSLTRAVTAGTTANIEVPTRLAGRVAPTAGTLELRTVEPIGTTSTGVLATNGGSLLLDQVAVPVGARLTTEGTPTLDGSVAGGGELVVGSGALEVRSAHMSGAGITRVATGATMRVTNPDSNGLMINDSRQLVNDGTLLVEHTTGSPESIYLNLVGAGVTNNGTIDLKNGADIVGPGTLVNTTTGTLTKTTGAAESTIGATTDNNGTVHVSLGILSFTGTVSSIVGDRLDEGTWHAVSPGKIRFPVDVRANAATIVLDGADAMIQDGGTTTDALSNLTAQTPSGSLTVRGGRVQPLGAITQQGTVVVGPGSGSQVNASSYTQTAGTTTLLTADARLKTTGATRINGGTLRGLGTVEAATLAGLTIDLGGRLEPGLDGPGTFAVTGNLVLGNAGRLAVDVDGTGAGQADLVNVSGTMTVGGQIVIDTGFTPALNNQVQVLASVGARTGKFTSAAGADLPGSISWAADYGTNGVTLVAARPGLRIGNATVVETDGATDLVFTVTQSRTLLTTASATATTSDGSAVDGGPAVGGNDYDARTGTVTVGFDQTTATFSVPVVGDDVYEHDDVLNATLTSPDNAVISDSTATGTISNDEAVPTLTVVPVADPVVEGDSGSRAGLLEARLSGVSAFTTGASWATVDGTATAADYSGGSGAVSFAPGDTSEDVAIAIIGDTATEADEYFDVTFSNGTPAGDVTLPPSRTITILDDDARVSVADATVDEPATGTTQVPVRFTLDHVNPRPVQFTVSTSDGSATAGSDYVAVNQTATIPAGTDEITIPVTVNSDAASEATEDFSVTASNVVGGQPGDTAATVTILSSTCTVVGTADNDRLRGTNGPDVFCGFGGNDVIFTGPGDDVIYGGAPGTGDAGIDTVSHAGRSCAIEADLRNRFAESALLSCTGRDILIGIENLVGGGGADRLRGNAGANRLDGTNGNDVLLGDGGNDRLIGGGGLQDFVSYDRGTVRSTFVLNGTTFANHGVTVDLAINAGAQNTRGAGNDWIQTVEGVFGSPYNDWLRGNGAANTLSGIDGNDSIAGLGGPDEIFGLLGDDALKGDAGADEVYGGEGTDVVNGGADADLWLTGGPGSGDRVYGDAGVETGDAIQGGDGVNDLCRQDGPTSAFFSGSGCEG